MVPHVVNSARDYAHSRPPKSLADVEHVVSPATVFVVDDDISVRESLELVIRSAGWQPRTFGSAEEFQAYLHNGTPCCLVLDVALPGVSGLELQTRLAEHTEMPIIFISGRGDVPRTVQAMKSGAFEFLTKPFKEEVLVEAIRAAIERSHALLRDAADKRRLRTRYLSLTQREREVMALVVLGLLNKQVAAELGITETTVKAHRGQVTRKMEADSLPDLVAMAATLGLPVGKSG